MLNEEYVKDHSNSQFEVFRSDGGEFTEDISIYDQGLFSYALCYRKEPDEFMTDAQFNKDII